MWKQFNNSPASRSVGDCAIRAVSVALNVGWETAYAMIAVNGFLMGDMPSIKTLDYTIRDSQPNNVHIPTEMASTPFATKDEVNLLGERLDALQSKLDGILHYPRPSGRIDT